MLITKENLDIWYREYQKQFKTTHKYITSRGGKVRTSTPLSRRDFEMDFLSESYDYPKLSGKQLAQRMAKQDLYVASSKEALRAAEAHIREFGGSQSFNLIMRYRIGAEEDIWEAIKIFRQSKQDEGFSSTQINILISQQYFGSP